MLYSLKYRIAGTILLLDIILISTVLWQTVFLSKEASLNQIKANEEVILNILSDLSRIALYSEEYEDLQFYIERIVKDPHVIAIKVTDHNARIIASSILSEVSNTLGEFNDSDDHFWLTRILYQGDTKMGQLNVQFSNKELREATRKALDTGISIGVVGILIIFLVSILIGFFLTRRLEVLTNIAQRLSKGQWNLRAKIEGNDEVAILGNSIDFMASSIEINLHKLQESQNLLQQANDELEDRVEMRTQELRVAKDAADAAHQQVKQSLLQLKDTQNQLVQSEKMASLGCLVAGVAHELNTPVGVCITAITYLMDTSQNLNERYAANQMTQEDFENFLKEIGQANECIHSNLQRASKLINSFKMVATAQSAEDKIQFSLFDHIEQVLISLGNRIKQGNVQVKVICNENLMIFSEPGTFTQIFTNLIINSLNHAFERAQGNQITIKIDVDQSKKYLEIEYRDNGKGIDKNILPKIFDPFFTTNRKLGNTGLGLHVVYNMVVSHLEGEIKADSDIGKGAVFTIKLPLNQLDINM